MIDIHTSTSVPEGKAFRVGNGPLLMHPDTFRHLEIELGSGTYADKCLAHERVRYEKRRRAHYASKAGS